MKVENDVIDVTQFVPHSSGARQIEAEKLVDTFYDDFKQLAGTQKGRVLNVAEEGDKPWPTIEEYRKFSVEEKTRFRTMTSVRCSRLLTAIRDRMKGGFVSSYKLSWNYVGSGKIVLWWRFIRKKNGTS